MTMKIKTRKTVEDGKMGRRIMEFGRILNREQIPSEYEKGECIYLSNDKKSLIFSNLFNLELNRFYNESDFQEHIQFMNKVGNRLHEINQRIKKLKETWNGEETFVI